MAWYSSAAPPVLSSTPRSMISTHGEIRVARRLTIFGDDIALALLSGRRPAAHGFRRSAQVARGKCVAIPAQVIRQPFDYLKPAGAVRALEPEIGRASCRDRKDSTGETQDGKKVQ